MNYSGHTRAFLLRFRSKSCVDESHWLTGGKIQGLSSGWDRLSGSQQPLDYALEQRRILGEAGQEKAGWKLASSRYMHTEHLSSHVSELGII